MQSPAIVVIAYDRPEALKRLLCSIENAEYADDVSPVLIISIDKSDSDDVINVAKEFKYSHGEKVIMARSERMGLRAHVLACGDLTEEYDSIIVLEDDLFVASDFYGYACAALDFCDGDDRIGAISLYDHRFNVHKRESFCAIDDGFDNYYLQLASSWGQAYSKKHWTAFKSWYAQNSDRDLSDPFVPENVTGWSDRSWLKYYIVYLIETNRYCLYPRVSLTTNFGDVGSHADKSDTDLQVPLSGMTHRRYDFSTLECSQAVYDSFFEPVGYYEDGKIHLGKLKPAQGDGLCNLIVDLYGAKPVQKMIGSSQKDPGKNAVGYVLSSAYLPYKVLNSFGRQMRPVDANIKYNVCGKDFFLYDVNSPADPPPKGKEALRFFYEYRGISAARMIDMIKYRIFEKMGGN